MARTEPHRLAATEIVRRIGAGDLTAEAVVASCLERIAAREPVVRAWCHLDGAGALAAARARDRNSSDCLLRGLPFGLKDIFDAADMPATYGSPIYAGWRPRGEASAASLPRAAGGILLGKTVTTEFASRHPGATTNPHDPDFSPGGSSSGSAAAVADFMVPLAIGTQTGGSVIRPAAYCGVVGFKPSFGLFPPAGMRANTEALDTVGIMARSVADIALFRAAMMAIPHRAPAPPDRAPRLALCRTAHWKEAMPEGRAVLEGAAERLAKAGATIIEAEVPASCGDLLAIQRALGRFEGRRNLAPELTRHEALLSPVLRQRSVEPGRTMPIEAYHDARRTAAAARKTAQAWAAGFDAILTPPAPGQAPRGLAETCEPMFNSLWTLLWMPCVTLPAGQGPDGLPVGVQLVGARHCDASLLDVASWVERTLGEVVR
jgi:Asp-tRNA(Asn)/Glu-tRNA(Gln) amidotransferase A subunit family amidase